MDCKNILIENGKLIFSFRDYSTELTDGQRFIPVKNDENKILTCILEYEPKKVKVTDLLYQKTHHGWKQKVSSYHKIRIAPSEVLKLIESSGMRIILNESIHLMQTIIAVN